MKPLPRLIESGDPEVRELLAAARAEAPGPRLLSSLQSALGVGAGSLAAATASAAASRNGATSTEVAPRSIQGPSAPMAPPTETGGALAPTAAAGETVISAVLAKSLVAGAIVSGVIAGGIFSGVTDLLSEPEVPLPAVTATLAYRAGAPPKSEPRAGTAPAVATPAAPFVDREVAPFVAREQARQDTRSPKPARESGPLSNRNARAPQPRPAEVDGEICGTLAQETEQIGTARRMLRSGSPSGALVALDHYDTSNPRGVLKREALVLRIEALVQQGNRRTARELAETYLVRYPNDANAVRMKEISNTPDAASSGARLSPK